MPAVCDFALLVSVFAMGIDQMTVFCYIVIEYSFRIMLIIRVVYNGFSVLPRKLSCQWI